jgi:AAA+ ATPase superfamily predicted ATPase
MEAVKAMNPFVYNAPVRRSDFSNRLIIMQKVMSQIFGKSQGDVWIIGERQVGKTSILQYIETNADDYVKAFLHYGLQKEMKPVFIYLNVQNVTDSEGFYEFFCYGLKRRFDIKETHIKKTYQDFINILISKFNDGFYTVFLIDEFDSMIEGIAKTGSDNVLSFIKKLNATSESIRQLPMHPKAFSLVYAANCSMSKLLNDLDIKETIGSGLKFEPLELEWFSKDQIKKLADNYLEKSDIRFTKSEIELCYKYTQGYPYFTQKFLFMMYEKKIAHQVDFTDEIIKEFGEEFERTIKAWGSQKMPLRTAEKIKKLAANTGEKIFDAGLKVLEHYLAA